MLGLQTHRGDRGGRELLSTYRRVAIVGLSGDPARPSYGVGHYLIAHGYAVTAVNPNAEEIFGAPAVASLDEVPGPLEIVNVFRRRDAIPGIVDDAIRLGAAAVWLQLGLSDHASEARARAAGLAVVRNRCIKVEHRRWFGPGGATEAWRAAETPR